MARRQKKINHTKKVVTQRSKSTRAQGITNYARQIAPKSIAQTRKDIKDWKRALSLAKKGEDPKRHLLYNLYDEIIIDGLLTSQIENRRLKGLSESFILKNSSGEIDKELTDTIQKTTWVADINRHILDTRYYGHSLIEFSKNEKDQLIVELIPRQNIDPIEGVLYPDYTEDKGIKYREQREYGIWVLEFGDPKSIGLLNNTVPHVLFKRFAQSCWSELCEIYGIPPRVLKTNTHDPQALSRGERMMRDMGAAAWFIIDESEKFEFAQGVSTNGDVYKNLISLCNSEMSMTITGAIIGQDTKNGSRSKDESSQEMLQTLVESDIKMVARYWNTRVIPALIKLGVVTEGTTYAYEKAENLEVLWQMTTQALPHYDVDPEWIKDKFGIQVTGKKQLQNKSSLNLDADFFV